MRPHQRTRRTRALPRKQFAIGYVLSIPDLLRNQPGVTSRIFHYSQQRFCGRRVPRRELVMRPLAREQRPWPSYAVTIKWRSILMLTVSIAVVAIPVRARRQLHAQQRVD